MRIVVVDLEMNSPENGGEVIQIGAVTLSTTLNAELITQPFMRYVKLTPNLRLDPRITELTGISQEQVDAGSRYSDALTEFWEYVGGRPVAAWGRDIQRLKDDSLSRQVPTPPRLQELDLKSFSLLFKQALPANNRKGGLKATMEAFGLQFVGRQHNALVDATNTAYLANHWLNMIRCQRTVEETIAGFQISKHLP